MVSGRLAAPDPRDVSMTHAVPWLRSVGVTFFGSRCSGQAALDVVREAPARFQLVLLDLRMPGLSGEATFDALSALAPRLPVLIWSGHNAQHDVRAMLERGAVGFVQKPYRVSELSRTIAQAMRARKPAPATSRVEAAHRA